MGVMTAYRERRRIRREMIARQCAAGNHDVFRGGEPCLNGLRAHCDYDELTAITDRLPVNDNQR